MRVLQVSSGLSAPGGAEHFCLELTSQLHSSGIDVGLAGSIGGVQGKFPAWQLMEERRKLFRKLLFDYVSPGNPRRLRQAVDEFRPDVIHFHNIYGISSQLVNVATELCPTVVTLHDYWPIDVFVPRVVHGRLRYPKRQLLGTPWAMLHRRFHRRMLSRATLVSPSRYLAHRLEEFGYRDTRIIPNGVHVPPQPTRYQPAILFVGRLTAEKGLQTVLSTAERIAQELSWSVDVVGEGPLRNHLEAKHRSVRFHGWVDPTEFYQRSSIVFVPSIWPENLPYVILEAMSYAIPVLASNVGGIPEIVAAGETGLLFEPGDSEQFANALREMAVDRAWLERAGDAARTRVVERFTWDIVKKQYIELYDELTATSRVTNASAQDDDSASMPTPMRSS